MLTVIPGNGPRIKQLAVILRSVLRDEIFGSSEDVLEALERDCRRLRVPYRRELAQEALELVGSNLRVLTPPAAATGRAEPPPPPQRGLTHVESTALLAELAARLSTRSR